MGTNVFLFVPNIIGYARIMLAFVSFYYMAENPYIFFTCYGLSTLLDAFDGYAARLLNQSSKFGAMLDMLTDRCATACLMVMLSEFYPSFRFVFQFLICLDVSSHWLHMYSSMLKGDQSHKKVDQKTNYILYLYYTSRAVLFTMCMCNEIFFVMLYLMYFTTGPTVFSVGDHIVGLWAFFALVSFPLCFVKQCISVVHLVSAAKDVTAHDLSEIHKSSS